MAAWRIKMSDTMYATDRADFLTLCDGLAEKKSTLILFHIHPDADAIGSAFALRSLLLLAGSPAFCVCADRIPKRLDFLVRGEQSGTLPEDIPADFRIERVVSTDVASPSQLGELADKYKVDYMIDHHGKGTPFGDYNYVRPTAAANAEIIFDISREFLRRGLVSYIPSAIDRRIYAGISSDTGCFRFSNVTFGTHMRAAELSKSDIDMADINHRLFESKPMKQLIAEHIGFERLKLHCGGKVATITFPADLKQSLGLEGEHLETLIDVARSVEGVGIAAVIRQQPSGSAGGSSDNFICRVSMRSSIDFDVSEICALFGGGGHKRAAGCSVTASSVEAAEQIIVNAVSDAIGAKKPADF